MKRADESEMRLRGPRIVVYSSLFPHAGQPGAGLFVRERMFRVGQSLPIVVVAPQPWFPLQALIRIVHPSYRPPAPRHEVQQHVDVYYPRFLALPGLLRRYDGFSMALCSLPTLRRLARTWKPQIIDAHFAYPSGYAATLLGKWLKLPVTITLRGTETGHLGKPALRSRVVAALLAATRVFAVSASLKNVAVAAGIREEKIHVIGNGVDVVRFAPRPRNEARDQLGIPATAKVLISVGGLVERKGFHRVMACLPALLPQFPDLYYLIVGGPGPEGDMSHALQEQARELHLTERVRFLGPMAPENLAGPLSAADVFVLATRNEGWANVFLEAMACGLPVVTTMVGGNAEVVCNRDVGRLVALGDQPALESALIDALNTRWPRDAIIAYAHANAWNKRIATLIDEFRELVPHAGKS